MLSENCVFVFSVKIFGLSLSTVRVALLIGVVFEGGMRGANAEAEERRSSVKIMRMVKGIFEGQKYYQHVN